jgi:O-antigen ligase
MEAGIDTHMTAIFYLLVYIGGLTLALSGRPLYGLYIYFFSFYFHAPSQWWGASLPSLRWSLIAAVVTMIVLFVKPPAGGLRFWTFKENRMLTAFAALVFAQLIWVNHTALHMEYVILITKFIILIFLIQNIVQSEKELRGVIWVNMLGCAYLAYYGMSMHTGGRMENYGNGSGIDSNLAGMHFAAMLVLGGYLLLEKFHKKQLILMGALAVIMMGLFMTESRGALLSLGATGVLAMLFRPQSHRKKFMVFGVLAVIAGSALMGPQIIERFQGMEKTSEGEMADSSAESRFVIINAQIEMWKESPWVGHGHRGTLVLSPQYIPDEYRMKTPGKDVRASHNVTMAILVDHGVVGAFLYFGTILMCGWRIFSYRLPQDTRVQTKEQRLFSNMQLGAILALFCFMMGGQGANNKKLEADIWLIALIPVLARRVKWEKEQFALRQRNAVDAPDEALRI